MKKTPVPDDVSALVPTLATRILEIIRREALPVGHRLTEHQLCDALGVSRSPVRRALQFLESIGAVASERNKGFRVATPPAKMLSLALEDRANSDEGLYTAITDDRLADTLPSEISESDLIESYGTSRLQLQRVLNRMARDGIIERKPGRGWAFLPLFNTPEAYLESFRFRMIIEPAALLEPAYQVENAELEKCYREQLDLLSGGIEKWPRSDLSWPGTHLHETIIAGAHNRLLLDALRRVNQLRRLVEYRNKRDRLHMRQQCEEHLVLIDLLRRGERVEASHFLREHLSGARRRKGSLEPSSSDPRVKRA